MEIDAMLDERKSRYGDFADQAALSQGIKALMRIHPKWHLMQAYQREALEMVAHKMARIVNGDPDYDDSWIDIVGYTQRVIERLPKPEGTWNS